MLGPSTLLRAILIAVLAAVALVLEAALLGRIGWAGAMLLLGIGLLVLLWLLWRYVIVRRQKDKDAAEFRDKVPRPTCCFPVSPKDWRKPDPFLYDQNYLKQLGFEVTYDNPDISFYQNGQLVPGNLQPDTTYEIVARIWNGSFQAPAFNVLVEFYIRHFGIGPVDRLIGSDVIPVIQVRGLPPSYARMLWKTPPAPDSGHYCIVVRLYCVDDANPENNQGQKNVNVGDVFPGDVVNLDLTIANGENQPISLGLEATRYEVPQAGSGSARMMQSADDAQLTDVLFRPVRKLLLQEALKRNGSGQFPLPAEAELRLPRDPVEIAPGQDVHVGIHVRMPRNLTAEQRANGYPITILALTQDGSLYGGVTYRLRPR